MFDFLAGSKIFPFDSNKTTGYETDYITIDNSQKSVEGHSLNDLNTPASLIHSIQKGNLMRKPAWLSYIPCP